MIYEYRCEAGHVIEAHVKLSGEGTPTHCTAAVEKGSLRCGVDDCNNMSIAIMATEPITGICHSHSYVLPWPKPVVKPDLCAKKLTRILSVGSPYFPGAGSWRGA